MKVLKNSGTRRLGIPGRPAIILAPGEVVPVTDDQLDLMRDNRTVARWLDRGVLTTEDSDAKTEAEAPVKPLQPAQPRQRVRPRVGSRADKREELVLPDGVTGEGIEVHHKGGGWYEVYVNGFKVTDTNVRKDEAQDVAAEYK
jgi:hypothetical protein